MIVWAYHRYDGKVESLSTEMLLREWNNILSRAQSYRTSKPCEILVKRLASSKPRLILMVGCEHLTISGEQILGAFPQAFLSLAQEPISKTSNPSSEQSSSPIPE